MNGVTLMIDKVTLGHVVGHVITRTPEIGITDGIIGTTNTEGEAVVTMVTIIISNMVTMVTSNMVTTTGETMMITGEGEGITTRETDTRDSNPSTIMTDDELLLFNKHVVCMTLFIYWFIANLLLVHCQPFTIRFVVIIPYLCFIIS